MNTDQTKGAIKKVAGETQKNLGRLVGSKEHEAKGLVREMEGTTQKTYGDAKDPASDAVRETTKAARKAAR